MIRGTPLRAALALACTLVPAPGPALPLAAQEPPDGAEGPAARAGSPLDHPFAEFRTHRLPNGIRLWFKRLPGAPTVAVGAAIPSGWDRDPEGLEQLAHFTEHVLFSDHRGRTEKEIKDELDVRGGRSNGYTTPDHTFYYATTTREHGTFAVEWLGRVLEPHAMDPDVVQRNRGPVALEIRARPWELPDRLGALLDPPWLRRPDFWRREFGLDTRRERGYDRWAALHRIGPSDLEALYQRQYAPGNMVVVVVGDLDEAEVVAAAVRGFALLPGRPLPDGYGPPRDPARRRHEVTFTFRHDVFYSRVFKFYDLDAEERLDLLFVERLLSRRLADRLRFGERKAVYGLAVSARFRGPAALLAVEGPIAPGDFDFARQVIDAEVRELREGGAPGRLDADRQALVEGLEATNRAAEDLVLWVHRAFYDPSVHPDFPDLAGHFAAMDEDRLAAFARRYLAPEREVLHVRRPHPLSRATVAVLGLLLALATVRATGHALTRPVDMRTLRYVARFRMSAAGRALLWSAVVGGAAVAGRLLWAGAERVYWNGVATVDAWPLHLAAWGAGLAGAVALAVLLLSRVPAKVLVFEDHVRVKAVAYRSRVIRPEDVVELARIPAGRAWASGRALRAIPLTSGLRGDGIWLATRRGRPLFFRVRDGAELLEVMGEVLGRAEPAAAAPAATPGAEPSPA